MRRRRSRRDETCPPTKRSSYPVAGTSTAARRSSYPASAPRSGPRESGPVFSPEAPHDRLPPTSRRRPGSRATYAREVLGLMRSGHGLSSEQAVRLLAKWNKMVDTAWRAQRTACWTADHVVTYDARGMCPCSSTGRDCSRCQTRRPRRKR